MPDLTFNNIVWYRFGHDLHYKLNYYQNYQATGLSVPNGTEKSFPTSETYGDKMLFNLSLPYNDVKFGGYYIKERFASKSFDPPIPGDLEGFNYNLYYYDYLSGFLQDTIMPIKNLSITPGIDYVYYNTQFINDGCGYYLANDPNYAADCQNDAANEGGEPSPAFGGSPNSTFKTAAIEPSIGVNYRILPFMALYGDWSMLYQNPRNGAFQYPAAGYTSYNALKPVQTIDSEFGGKFFVRHSGYLNNFVFNANYYQFSIGNNTLIYSSDVIPNLNYYASASAFYKGYNIYLKDEPIKNLNVFADLNLQHDIFTYYKDLNGTGKLYNGYPISDTPGRDLNLSVSYKIPYDDNNYLFKPMIVDQYIGKQYLFSNNYSGDYQDPTHQTMPGYNLVDFILNIKTKVFNNFIPEVKSSSISMEIDNVFNKEYNNIEYYSGGGIFGETTSPGYGDLLAEPGMPRAFYVSLSFHFGAPEN